MTPLPRPDLIARLREEFPHASENDIAAIWHNTSRLETWQYVPKHIRESEPPELSTARAFHVRARLSKHRKRRAAAEYARDICIGTYADYSRPPDAS